MKIVMITNTYLPHVGGVARSVAGFSSAYRKLGHEVLVVAPEFEDMPEDEKGVFRIKAVQNFNGSDFSVVLPAPEELEDKIEEFAPDILHAHHPFLLGSTAYRLSCKFGLPLCFTHHTLYEHYTHYVPGDSQTMADFAIQLGTAYANLCDHVFAPSTSIEKLVKERGVTTGVSVLPTGVDLNNFTGKNGDAFRDIFEIPRDKPLLGHVGRLAEEKNLPLLIDAAIKVMKNNKDINFLLAGEGDALKEIKQKVADSGLESRFYFAGRLSQPFLATAYAAMDLFVFASQSETQGMVITEAMASGTPVAAIRASGVNDVLQDGKNGFCATRENPQALAEAIEKYLDLGDDDAQELADNGRAFVENEFSRMATAKKAVEQYKKVIDEGAKEKPKDTEFNRVLSGIKAEWELVKGKVRAVGNVLGAV